MPALLNHDQLEDWMKDNHWIVRGYRPLSNSYRACVRTIFQGHNETVNIVSRRMLNLRARSC